MRRGLRYAFDPFGSRLQVVALLFLFSFVLLGIRFFAQSVLAHGSADQKARGQYLVKKLIEPRRGLIIAQDASAEMESSGLEPESLKPLAANRRTYALSVVPRNVSDPMTAAKILAPWAELSEEELYQKINNDRLYLPPLRRGLTEEQKDQLLTLDLPGLLLLEEEQRYYPEGTLAAQLLGFVNAERKGKYGLEQFYDEDLQGSGGEVVAERDVAGRILAAESSIPVRDGSTLVLTIDRNVQGFVEETLQKAVETFQADSGSIVVMDVKTGGIVALANAPTFDPNQFRQLPKEEQNKFLNSATSAVWEPGSIFKPIVMAAALDHGVVQPETEGTFSNKVVVQGYEIHTAEDKAFGKETMTQVLENSDNVAMVWVADQLGNQRLAETLEKFGLGEVTGIDLPGEVGGVLPDVKDWRDINRATLAFGQGVSVTPLQLTTAMAALANGGQLLQPHLVTQIISPDGAIRELTPKIRREHIISAETSAKITAMMVSVVENGHGKKARVPGYKIAGKTGTAQVPNPEGGYYEDRHIGGFGGFFPADQPRFAMVVKLDQPKTVRFAESSAAPTFGEIARFMLNYYRIPPTEPIE